MLQVYQTVRPSATARAAPITRNQGAPVTPSGISSSATVRGSSACPLVAPCAVRGLCRVRAVRPSDGRGLFAARSCAVRGASLAARPSVTPCRWQAVRLDRQRAADHAQPCAPSAGHAVGLSTGKAREPLPFARRRVRCRMIDRRNRARGSSLRAPCAACGASAPSARLSVAACAPCAPVPSVARSSRCARPSCRRPVRFRFRQASRATVRGVRVRAVRGGKLSACLSVGKQMASRRKGKNYCEIPRSEKQ